LAIKIDKNACNTKQYANLVKSTQGHAQGGWG